jgi:hypothetical protein
MSLYEAFFMCIANEPKIACHISAHPERMKDIAQVITESIDDMPQSLFLKYLSDAMQNMQSEKKE